MIEINKGVIEKKNLAVMLYLHVDLFSTDSLSWKMVDLRDQSCLIHA